MFILKCTNLTSFCSLIVSPFNWTLSVSSCWVNRKGPSTCLHVSVFPSENDDDRKTADNNAGQDEYGGSHYPVQGHDARPVVFAGLASFWTGKTLEYSRGSVLTQFILK